MRKMTGQSPSGAAKIREIDGSKGAARQATATRSRLRLYAVRESLRGDKSRPITRGDA
jgi:hypothetical protein